MKIAEIEQRHLNNFQFVERAASSLSLVGIVFIIVSYSVSNAFHKPINRLVLYASVGNIFTNVATIISRDALDNPGVCKLQAFLIQLFMSADAYWTLAMACNVWLTFYQKYDAARLRKLEKYYLSACYGFPFILAFSFIFIKTEAKGPMYGNATLWCWIAGTWDIFRVACFYGPIWVSILITLAIYLRAGKDIYVKRQQLLKFHTPVSEPIILTNPFAGPNEITRTTDISVNYENVGGPTSSSSQRRDDSGVPYPAPAANPKNEFTVDISSAQGNVVNPYPYPEKSRRASMTESIIPIEPTVQISHQPRGKHNNMEANNAAWAYTKVSLLFFVAMMITWIPSSANRVYSVVHPGQISLPLQYASALVLPLQGFWNALIYTITSAKACRKLWHSIRNMRPLQYRSRRRRANFAEVDAEHHGATRSYPNKTQNRSFSEESDSMTGLKPLPRPNTKGSSL
ncbi:uncharacterized protein BP5553_00764 [Venustampulla echinocandica]|uniref:G-protein coupled receptors family 2 profile 2 domain-containing protein n=1 Tax=Venustampulla echinocandica TaxID=2656787 RepID=A0A370TZ45_9HELO|nr:uncharacterized protein BP5553_00764 [Venustampulla echinocandica]RDL40785.1 hypothetical protein BP5553_00764 [Venustampulla echinocandica]